MIDYSAAGVAVRDDLTDAHQALWAHIAAPGNWWTGAERVAAVAAARAAQTCPLCCARRDALSPNAVPGRHASAGALPDAAVDVVHRVRADPGRLSRAWYEHVRAAGVDDGAYVELVGLVALSAGVDDFARALGTAPPPLPAPQPGAPSHYRPAGAKDNGAWVPTIAAADATGGEAELYGGAPLVPNIGSALSLVPEAARQLRRLSAAHYMAIEHVPDPGYQCGALDRLQMELVAARVSALNQCFY
jgi:alkylhydroperoxidase family enzyme